MLKVGCKRFLRDFNPIQDRPFCGCSRMGEVKSTLPKIYYAYSGMMRLGTIITCLRKIQKNI